MTQRSKSDRDTLKEMLDRAGVVYDETLVPGELCITAKDGPKNEGYSGFFVCFEFSEDGTLMKVSIWE